VTDSLLHALDITVTFGRGLEAFDAVSKAEIQVQAGEAVGIVGESGSGKTTLARVLVGLQQPTEGAVWLDGEQIFSAESKLQISRRDRWKLQMVFQDPYSSLNPRMRVWEAVAEALQVWRGLPRKVAKSEALGLLSSVGVSAEQARQLPKALSGGQRQRVSVARALAPNPRILIADEPTSSIDQSAQAQLLNLLRRLQRERNLTVVFISHDLQIIRYLTSRVYVMQKGVMVESGETQRVFSEPEQPYTKLLIDSIPGKRPTERAL
jgi:peptide/nickel transport system ATP-binding protein